MPELLTYVLIALAVAALLGVVLEEVTHVNKAKVTLGQGQRGIALQMTQHRD